MKHSSSTTRITGRMLVCLAMIAVILQYCGTSICAAASGTRREAASPVDRVTLDQRLNAQVPLDAQFMNEAGSPVALSDYIDRRPVVLVPAYYRCPMLCTVVINSVVDAAANVALQPGKDFKVVVFSIDSRETPSLAAEKKLTYLRRFGRNDTQAGWHFLTGSESMIRRVTDALGYGYAYDPGNDQFAHPAAVAVLTSEGRIARYLLGVDYKPRDLRLALVEASKGRIGTVVDQVLLRCYHYDPSTGRYGFAIMTAIRVAGGATVLGLAGAVYFMRHRSRSQRTIGRRRTEQ